MNHEKKFLKYFMIFFKIVYEAKYKQIWKRAQNINSYTNASKIINSTCTSNGIRRITYSLYWAK